MDKSCAKISIIIPVYKVEKYLKRCVESVCGQTYGNLEIILVDDGSPDNCPKMCDEYAKSDSRIVVIHKENGGLSSARNAALDIATGSYILCVDSDDYIHPTAVEKLYQACQLHDADISMGLHFVEKGEKLLIEDPVVDEVEIYGARDALEVLLLDKKMRNYAWNKLYKAELFEGVRYPEGKNYEDIPTTYQLFYKAKAICRIPEYLYYYQMRDDSISGKETDEKWFENCKDIVWGYKQQVEFFREKGENKLAEISLYHLVHYIYTVVDTGIRLGKPQGTQAEIQYLLAQKESVYGNSMIEGNLKTRLKIYEKFPAATGLYTKVRKGLRQIARLRGKGKRALKNLGIGLEHKYDFSLAEGKDTRLVFFELPCFDNLGDHAIAYAGKEALTQYVQKHQNCQLYIVKSWDAVDGIAELKRCVGKNDIIFCQGGGNMGNLYPFAEVFRNKVLQAFSAQRIVIFPQSILFTEDAVGQAAFAKNKEIINKCERLTLCARDHVSYEIMRGAYSINVVEMRDVVSFLDKKYLSESLEARKGIVLCLRSDVESALESKQKKYLQVACEKLTSELLISDTVAGYEVTEEERESVLIAKWKTFGKAKMVVTDRLHGMIFALITGTPCVILGNNHHKVKETFKTLQSCGYLYYAETVEEAEVLMQKVYFATEIADCRKVEDIVEKIEQLIL